MSNPILQEFEPLDALVAVIAPRCGQSSRDLRDFVLRGVTSDTVRFSKDGREPIEWGRSEFAARPEPSLRATAGQRDWSSSPNPSWEFNVFDPNLGASRSSGWQTEASLDRFKAALSNGMILIETLSALSFLEANGIAVASVREALAPSLSKELRTGSRLGRKPLLPWEDMVLDLVAVMQDDVGDGRMTSGQAEEWAIQWAAERGVATDRSTVQPYVKQAFDAFDRWTERRFGKRAGN